MIGNIWALVKGGLMALGWLAKKDAEQAGEARARADAAEKVNENVRKSNDAAARLEHDPGYRQRLRRKHTRDR